MFFTNPFISTVQSFCILDPEVGLIFFRQIFGTEVIDMTVCVPFNIGNMGRQGDHIVECLYHKVLYSRIAQVEQPLVTHRDNIPFAALHDPFRMLFRQFALRTYHFRFNPYTEFQTFIYSVFRQVVDTTRQFLLIHLPVTQADFIRVARILIGKPAIV